MKKKKKKVKVVSPMQGNFLLFLFNILTYFNLLLIIIILTIKIQLFNYLKFLTLKEELVVPINNNN